MIEIKTRIDSADLQIHFDCPEEVANAFIRAHKQFIEESMEREAWTAIDDLSPNTKRGPGTITPRAVIVAGNLNEGFHLIGPFLDFDDASMFADTRPHLRDAWIMQIDTPAQAEHHAIRDLHYPKHERSD